MKTKRYNKPHLLLPVVIIFSLHLQTSANHSDYPGVRNETWNPISQNQSGSQNVTEANTNSLLSIDFSSRPTTFKTQKSTLQSLASTTAPNSTSAPARSAVSAAGGSRNSSKPRNTTTKDTCEDNKSLILICFVVIAVLVLICTFLFLSTVVIANKLSYLKKSQQGKRRPRSNGDILATNSLWPTAAGTWQRVPKVTAGTELTVEGFMAGRTATDRTTQKLTKETDNEQENKEPKPHNPILTNFVVEI
ncbi:EVI2A protein, partial [Thinocorus orbignyianus]|nr:EVI2A protein [Thinocorus orbignyianus]